VKRLLLERQARMKENVKVGRAASCVYNQQVCLEKD